MGPLSAAVGYAIAPYLDGKKVPTIFPIVSSEDITQRKRSPYIVRTGWTSAQPMHPFGTWVYENLKYRKIAMIGYDFAFGWEVAAGFHRTFEDAGGPIVQKLRPPLHTPHLAAYEAKFRQVPSYYSEGTYVAGIALKAALEATGGDIENVDKFLGALRRADLSDAPRGAVRFDDFGNPIQNIYVRRVEKAGGRLQNTVIHTFPSVSQFWTYKPEEYLKNPVYSRDYPPCRHC